MIQTGRLLLRPIGPQDREAIAALLGSSVVRHYLGGARFGDAAERRIEESMRYQADHGMSRWGMERRTDGRLIGQCGLVPYLHPDTPITGDIEMGWQLAEDCWGQGYAREAAEASLAWGWANLTAPRIVAITVPANRASVALMERIGMTPRPDLDFDHPLYPPGDALRRHIAYEVLRP
ncbi:GNAT family N-acetyltransferase [Sphingomonas sp. AP4-R1]|uniref:GNAT family N-acetyltransferase n=1 Tax=Sphingomonas sp. AP4-R1 TaxID=2735134 RepID=UPI0014938B78|nr:GNAT family N-acetyltransferase [Sphingomonas sp. AP4-R1]QJU56820.1 GNAT family N-acetyltransferase [Sphingomonas sp. AP4-R1]